MQRKVSSILSPTRKENLVQASLRSLTQAFARQKNRSRLLPVLLALALLIAVTSMSAFAESDTDITRTPWQMHRGLDRNGDGIGNDVIPITLESTSDPTGFTKMEIPAINDPGWKAPNKDAQGNVFIEEDTQNALKALGCNKGVDFTYFQTLVDIPAGTEVTQFEVTFDQVDDLARIYIFNSSYPDGKNVGEDVQGGSAATVDLKDVVVAGEANRVVVVQFDSCPVKNNIKNIQIEVNGSVAQEVPATDIPVPTTPEPTNFTLNGVGDVHVSSPDGLRYDFQEMGDFLAIQSDDGKVIVQARQEAWENNPRVSVNKAVALWVDGDKVEFYLKPERSLQINDAPTDFPTEKLALPKGGSIDLYGENDFLISWPNNSFAARVIVRPTYMDYGMVRYEDTRIFEGFMGNMDGSAANDLPVRGGDLIKTPPSIADLKSFGDSWRLSPQESLFDNAGPAGSPEPPLSLQEIDPQQRNNAKQTCRDAGVSEQTALRNCTYDVGVTGDKEFIKSAKDFEESIKDTSPSANVPAQPGETLSGNIFDADQAVRSGISILDGDNLIITTGTLADGTSYVRFNIYRDDEYVASFSVSTDAVVADAIAGAMFATMEVPAKEPTGGSGPSISEEDIAKLQEAIPVCAEGLILLADNMYEYPNAADSYAEVYETFTQEYLPACQAVSDFISTYEEEVGAFFDEAGFSFEDFVASDGYSKANWSDTIGTITGIGTRVPQYCPNAHLAQYDCVKASERSILSIDAALSALDLLSEFSAQ